jgi:hypothetical protein
MVDQLTAVGVPRDRAERRIREMHPGLDTAVPRQQERAAEALEKDEQREIRKLLVSFGFRVYWLSQAKQSGQTPGLADLWSVHERLPIAFWWETKRQVGGRHSPAQVEFAWLNTRAGVASFCGDRYDAQQLLVELELAEPGPYPPHPTARLRGAPPASAIPEEPPPNVILPASLPR